MKPITGLFKGWPFWFGGADKEGANITQDDLLIPDEMPDWWKQIKVDRQKKQYEYCKKIFQEESEDIN